MNDLDGALGMPKWAKKLGTVIAKATHHAANWLVNSDGLLAKMIEGGCAVAWGNFGIACAATFFVAHVRLGEWSDAIAVGIATVAGGVAKKYVEKFFLKQVPKNLRGKAEDRVFGASAYLHGKGMEKSIEYSRKKRAKAKAEKKKAYSRNIPRSS